MPIRPLIRYAKRRSYRVTQRLSLRFLQGQYAILMPRMNQGKHPHRTCEQQASRLSTNPEHRCFSIAMITEAGPPFVVLALRQSSHKGLLVVGSLTKMSDGESYDFLNRHERKKQLKANRPDDTKQGSHIDRALHSECRSHEAGKETVYLRDII